MSLRRPFVYFAMALLGGGLAMAWGSDDWRPWLYAALIVAFLAMAEAMAEAMADGGRS